MLLTSGVVMVTMLPCYHSYVVQSSVNPPHGIRDICVRACFRGCCACVFSGGVSETDLAFRSCHCAGQEQT